MLALALASVVVLSQSDVYTWVDEDGVTHYTDGATGVPENAEKSDLPGAVTVIPREPGNLAKPLPPPAPAASAPAPSAASASSSASKEVLPHAPATASSLPPQGSPAPGFAHTNQYPGLEGLDVYYRNDPWPLYAPYGCGYRQGYAPRVRQQQQPAQPAPEPVTPPPAPKPPKERRVRHGGQVTGR